MAQRHVFHMLLSCTSLLCSVSCETKVDWRGEIHPKRATNATRREVQPKKTTSNTGLAARSINITPAELHTKTTAIVAEAQLYSKIIVSNVDKASSETPRTYPANTRATKNNLRFVSNVLVQNTQDMVSNGGVVYSQRSSTRIRSVTPVSDSAIGSNNAGRNPLRTEQSNDPTKNDSIKTDSTESDFFRKINSTKLDFSTKSDSITKIGSTKSDFRKTGSTKNYSTMTQSFSTERNLPRVTLPKHTLLTFSETPCARQHLRIRSNIALHEPVILEFKMRRNSGFVVNQCFVLLTGPSNTRVSVVLLEMSCKEDLVGRAYIANHQKRPNRLLNTFTIPATIDFMTTLWNCVRQINPGVDWTSNENRAFFWVSVKGVGLFTVRMHVMVVGKPEPGTILTRYLTPTLGYLQNARLQLGTRASSYGGPVQTDAWSHLAVPGNNAVLISVAIAGLGSLPPAKACEHRVELYEGGVNRTVWRLCSRFPSLPQPHTSYEEVVSVHFVSDRNDILLLQGIGFRLIFTFHQKSSIPTQLSNGKWNCSTQTWLLLRHHFICDLISQCAGGEDETNCPVYTQCGHNGVVWHGRCFSLTKLDPGTTWHQANAVCSKLGSGGRLTARLKDMYDFLNRRLRIDLTIQLGHVLLFGHSSSIVDNHFYDQLPQSTDSTIEYRIEQSVRKTFNVDMIYGICVRPRYCMVRTWRVVHDKCTEYTCYGLCETKTAVNLNDEVKPSPAHRIVLPITTRPLLVPFPHVTCDQGQVTHSFLALDQQTHCFHEASSILCHSSVCGRTGDGRETSLPVPFACSSEAQHVHYTLVCDHRHDCQDNSDEDFCFFPPCDPSTQFECETNQECQPLQLKCNHQPDCLDGSDEGDCRSINLGPVYQPSSPFVILVDLEGRHGWPILTFLKNVTAPYCPRTHYLCPSDGNCMPVYTRCNRVADCSEKEDERECDSYVCPGLYRCRGRELCVLPSDLCDGVLHCPQHDDERFCHLPCPDHCTCLGHAFVCRRPFNGRRFQQLRYLDARGSGMKLEGVAENVMLIYLNLARCNVTQLSNVTLPNLKSLDLSNNKLTSVGLTDLGRFNRLRDLILSGNPLSSIFGETNSVEENLTALKVIDLSGVKLETLSLALFATFPNLQLLNLSKSGVNVVHKTRQHTSLPRTLRELDARGCDVIEFPRTLFQGLDDLKVVFAETYKLCCPAVLPEKFAVDNCHAHFDEISSCDDLLRSHFYRSCLSVLATFSLLGNSVSFVVRFCAKKANSRSGFGVFVQHLCVSDFLMGIYLVFIGVADRLFLSIYLWEDTSWRHSAACKLAGFISLASCEVSTFIICLITVDRFLVLRFPFSQLRFRSMSAQIVSMAAWVAGGALATVPLLPVSRTWQFYSQTGICIPLPVTRQEFPGQGYAFGVMIVLNFVLFILIAGGQISIYASIQAGKMSDGERSSKSRDAAIARRLITVVVSDFLCWFPVGLLGLLASSGTPVPGTVNVAVAIFVLPLNSALNPFLYTLNMLQERFQKRKEDRMLKILMQQKEV